VPQGDLKAMRGDYDGIRRQSSTGQILAAVREGDAVLH